MVAAEIPANEAGRLAALRAFNILDTPPEQAFDDITLLASHICDTPVALITLVDENRQWFKSRIGYDKAESSRDISFCAHTILRTDDIFVVRDTLQDPRFHDNPFVTSSPHVRFYAGAPLVTSTGMALGSLCVMDRKPRDMTPEQLAALRALRRDVIAELELRKTAFELRESEERYRTVFENAMDVIFSLSLDGTITAVNPAFERESGWRAEEWIGQHIIHLLHPSEVRRALRLLGEVKSNKIPPTQEFRIRVKNGSYSTAEFRTTPFIRDGSVAGFLGIARNVTGRKQAEHALRQANELLEQKVHERTQELRLLSARVQDAIEEQRAMIAREVHDELGAALTRLQMDLGWLAAKGAEDGAAAASRIVEMQSLVGQTIQSIQKISAELRPAMLDDLGLGATIEWYVREFERHSGVRCTLTLQSDTPNLTRTQATALYRILQEALTNIMRHASASEARVALFEDEQTVYLRISDNGRGIPSSKVASIQSMGLLGMKERARMIGGELLITTDNNSGTSISVNVSKSSSD